jgi:hypothetical protein
MKRIFLLLLILLWCIVPTNTTNARFQAIRYTNLFKPASTTSSFTYINGASKVVGSGVNSATTTAFSTLTAKIIVIVTNHRLTISPTISDSKSNTWTLVRSQTNSSAVDIYYCVNPTTDANHTFTVDGGSGSSHDFNNIFVGAWTGSSTITLDQQNGNQTAGTSGTANSITPTVNNELVIAALTCFIGTSITINSSYNVVDVTRSFGSGNYGSGMAYIIQTTAAATNPTWSWTTSANYAAAICSFKL